MKGQTELKLTISGVQSTVTFAEMPRTDLQHFLQRHPLLSSRTEDDRILYVYDCKAQNDKFSERYPTRPFFLPPPLGESHLATCLAATGPQDKDMFVILDARRLEAGSKFKKAINKSSKWKGAASFFFRLCYDNQEFGVGGYASTRTRSSIGAPDGTHRDGHGDARKDRGAGVQRPKVPELAGKFVYAGLDRNTPQEFRGAQLADSQLSYDNGAGGSKHAERRCCCGQRCSGRS